MDYYFDLYEFFDNRRVRFVKLKLKYSAQDYWTIVKRQLARTYVRPIETWDEMKGKLKNKIYSLFL